MGSVVDENCRVHSEANLYIASSSVFPTDDANNPTVTRFTLALRLVADVLNPVLDPLVTSIGNLARKPS